VTNLEDVTYDEVEEFVYTNPFLADKLKEYLNNAFQEMDKRLNLLVPKGKWE